MIFTIANWKADLKPTTVATPARETDWNRLEVLTTPSTIAAKRHELMSLRGDYVTRRQGWRKTATIQTTLFISAEKFTVVFLPRINSCSMDAATPHIPDNREGRSPPQGPDIELNNLWLRVTNTG